MKMRAAGERSFLQARRQAGVTALFLFVIALGGCSASMPGWVPFVGKKVQNTTTKDATAPRPAAEPVAAAVSPAAGPPQPAQRAANDDDVMDRVVAVVNNDVITLTELRETVLYYKIETRQQGGDDAELARQLLGRLIESRLQLQEADREKIGVDDVELTEELAARMKKANASSEQEFEAMLRQQGLTMDVVKRKLREQLLMAKVIRRKVAFRVSVTEQEVDRYLAENRDKLETGLTYHARHIVIPPEGTDDGAWTEARTRADAVHARLAAGADFAEVAQEVSRDATAKEGGDLGTLKKGELAEKIEVEILRLAPGQVSSPFKTDMGFHIFKLESKDTLEGETLGRARQQIRDILFRQKYQTRLEAWLAEIKLRAIIDVRI